MTKELEAAVEQYRRNNISLEVSGFKDGWNAAIRQSPEVLWLVGALEQVAMQTTELPMVLRAREALAAYRRSCDGRNSAQDMADRIKALDGKAARNRDEI